MQDVRFIKDTFTDRLAPWSFKHRAWQKALFDDLSPRVVVCKAAQMGVTELAMGRAMHAVDVLGTPTLYVFPTVDDAASFSSARFDAMLADSPYLERVFNEVSNVSVKRAGSTPLYFRGCTRRALKSVPVGALVLDELDEMDEESVALARKRLQGHTNPVEWNLSTPHYPGEGIHAEYMTTDQRIWEVPCPHCEGFQEIIFENLVLDDGDPRWICRECGKVWTEQQRLELLDKGHWRPQVPEAEYHGYHISLLYSPVVTAKKIKLDWIEAQRSATRMTEFHNSDLGLAYEAQGVNLTKNMVRGCMGMVPMIEGPESGRTYGMGIDVGLRCHYWIGEYCDEGVRVVHMGDVGSLEEADYLVARYNPSCIVVDALPERHKSMEFRARMSRLGKEVYLAFYAKSEELSGADRIFQFDQRLVKIHRTARADLLAERIHRGTLILPGDTNDECVRHVSSVYRATVEGKDGQPRAVWKSRGPDHYFHAGIYMELALEWATGQVLDLDLPDSDTVWETGSSSEFGFYLPGLQGSDPW